MGRQIVAFGLVSSAGVVIQLAVFVALVAWKEGIYLLAAVIAYLVAWLHNFILHRRWTFATRESPALAQAGRYFISATLALALNLGLLQSLVLAGLEPIPAQALAILVIAPFSFLIARQWSFRSARLWRRAG